MDKKILAGIFVILGLTGIGFAWFGFNDGDPAPDIDREAIQEHMETCRAYFESDEAIALRDGIHTAMEAGDEDKVVELREQMMENTPEGCMPMHRGHGMMERKIIESIPDDVQEEFKAAMENHDLEALKALKEEYFPEMPEHPEGFERPFARCNCVCETEE